jgi:hypothetical protein
VREFNIIARPKHIGLARPRHMGLAWLPGPGAWV